MEHPRPALKSISVAARFSSLPALLSIIPADAGGAASSARHRAAMRATLAVEELFANSIHHGYEGESDQPVWLSVEHRDTSLHVTYMDAAAEFDPFADLAGFSGHVDAELEHRRIGGLGRMLMKETARHCAYRREGGRNVITLEYAVE